MTQRAKTERLDGRDALYRGGVLHDCAVSAIRIASGGSAVSMRLTDLDNWDRRELGEPEVEYRLRFLRVPYFSRVWNPERTVHAVLDVDVLVSMPRSNGMVFEYAWPLEQGDLGALGLADEHRGYEGARIVSYPGWQLIVVFGDVVVERLLVPPRRASATGR